MLPTPLTSVRKKPKDNGNKYKSPCFENLLALSMRFSVDPPTVCWTSEYLVLINPTQPKQIAGVDLSNLQRDPWLCLTPGWLQINSKHIYIIEFNWCLKSYLSVSYFHVSWFLRFFKKLYFVRCSFWYLGSPGGRAEPLFLWWGALSVARIIIITLIRIIITTIKIISIWGTEPFLCSFVALWLSMLPGSPAAECPHYQKMARLKAVLVGWGMLFVWASM